MITSYSSKCKQNISVTLFSSVPLSVGLALSFKAFLSFLSLVINDSYSLVTSSFLSFFKIYLRFSLSSICSELILSGASKSLLGSAWYFLNSNLAFFL